MSFFNRNNPQARTAPPPAGGVSYDRIPSPLPPAPPSHPTSYQPQQPQQPMRRAPPADPYQSGRGGSPSPAPPAQPQGGRQPVNRNGPGYGGDQGGYAAGGGGYERGGYGGQAPPSLPPRDEYRDDYKGGSEGYGRGVSAPAHRSQTSGQFSIVGCPNEALALTNRLVVNPHDFPGGDEVIRVKGQYILGIVHDPTGTVPSGSIGPSKFIRQWAQISSMAGETAEVERWEVGNVDLAASVELEVGFQIRRTESNETYDTEALSEMFANAFDGLPISPMQPLVFDYRGLLLKALVRTVSSMESMTDDVPAQFGIINPVTDFTWFKDPQSAIKLKNTSSKKAPTTAIIAPNFKFEDMGIGGLDTEFSAIFRRAFASRIFPPGLVEKLGIQHVKGILLFGPPGTGKTLMARQIGKMLNAREPKVVNGPEILNKYVGASEENIRKLFEDAEKEQKEKGDESGLHIIIFDELDAICKQRGSTGGGTGVGDSVVNQLLSKMDGVDQLNNVLIIGMTNRMDMIDEALLRPGRLEVHIEISLPDEAGRRQILGIHTSKMKANGVMGADVDIAELASITKNFSGAEINGLVKSATSFAFNRHVKVGTVAGISDDIENIQITRADFMMALDEVHPAFGVSEEELQQVVQNGIIHFSHEIDEILRDGNLFVEQVRNSQRTPLVSVLIHGPAGSGKTALAATMAMASDFPFIKLISPESMVGYNESMKVEKLNKVFTDAYKSPLSVIVIDSIERILDWIPIGPRFSNSVLQALVVLLGKRPPKGRRLLVFATTSNRPMLSDMEISDAFDADIRVGPITTLKALDLVLHEVELFPSEKDQRKALSLLEQAGFAQEGKLNVGVKKLLSMAEMARQDPDPAEKLVGSLLQYRG